MKKRILFFITALWITLLFVPKLAFAAFNCGSTQFGNINYTMAAANIPKRSSDTPLTSSAFRTSCSGHATYSERDALRLESVTVNPLFENAGYRVEVSIGGGAWQTSLAALYACIWPLSNTGYNCTGYSSTDSGATRSVTARVVRNSDAAIRTAIPNNTTIASIVISQRSNNRWYNRFTLNYNLSGEISAVVPTCDVRGFDNNVVLPEVSRTDLVAQGAGRYTGVTKAFNINLACEYQPEVSITFDGDKMPGVTREDVLENKVAGNSNVGIQLVHDNNALIIGEKVTLINSADDNESLTFNAYYYYKSGNVQGGAVRAQSVFTFDYQ